VNVLVKLAFPSNTRSVILGKYASIEDVPEYAIILSTLVLNVRAPVIDNKSVLYNYDLVNCSPN
jgi:hypothetical protein